MKEMKSHINGVLETVKFARRKAEYYKNLDLILGLGHEKSDYLHHFPAFAGLQTLNRFITLQDHYRQVLGISGHIAEIGVYKGAGSILFGKLIQLYEPESLTMVHGFDWFRGTSAVPENPLQVQGGNVEEEERLRRLILLQNLDNTVKIHKLNVEKDLSAFFHLHPHLRFKMVFLDSGTYECTAAAIEAFWSRLNTGGVLVFDQYNNEVAPGETRAVTELLPNEIVRTLPNSWMPSAYIRKGDHAG